MRIVIDMTSGYSAGSYGVFLNLFIKIAERQHDHSFHLMLTGYQCAETLRANIYIEEISTLGFRWPARNALNQLLYKRKIGAFKSDMFIAVDNYNLPAKIKTSLLLTNLRMFMFPGEYKTTGQTRREFSAAVKRAGLIITRFAFYNEWLQKTYQIPAEKLKVLKMQAGDSFRALNIEEKEEMKETYTAGKEFFLFAGDLHERHQLLLLLAAFSNFKKWQKSNMQLVIAGGSTEWTGLFEQKLSAYKYREDVHLIRNPGENQLTALIGSAYCFVYPALHDQFPVNILRALKCETPVISSAIPEVIELAGDSIIYMEDNLESLSSKMQLIYKDEQLREKVIDRGKKLMAAGGESDMVDEFWNLLLEHMH